jgi:hypothetical protein
MTFEVEEAIKFFLTSKILPSEYVPEELHSINKKLDDLINRQFGFLKVHEEKMIKLNADVLQKVDYIPNLFIQMFDSITNLQSLGMQLQLDAMKVLLDEKEFEKYTDEFIIKLEKSKNK